jgi:hypothetical protein
MGFDNLWYPVGRLDGTNGHAPEEKGHSRDIRENRYNGGG